MPFAAGYTIPKGVSVLAFTMGLHRDPKVFPNPENFDPDRFMAKNCFQRNPFSYIPFSAGPRNCIGIEPYCIFIHTRFYVVCSDFSQLSVLVH